MKKVISPLFRLTLISSMLLSFLPLHTVLAESYITLDSFSGVPAPIHVSGGGWTPGETVSLYLNAVSGTPVAVGTADSNSFLAPTAIAMPANTPQGAVTIIAIGSTSKDQKTNTYYVTPFNPKITLTGNTTPGSTLTIDGQGYAANEDIRFVLNGNTIGQATADTNGSFKGGSAIVPYVPSYTYELHGIGNASNADAKEYVYVGGFFPSATPSAYFLLGGQILNFSGGGFAPQETINISEGGNSSPLASFITDTEGNFANAGNITLPLRTIGPKTYQLFGTTSKTSASTEITIGQFNPLVAPSSFYILPGQALTFIGGGFAGNETIQVVEGNNQTELAQLTADAEGNFTNLGSIIIPYEWMGSGRTFHLVGQMSGAIGDAMITVGQFNSLVSPSTYIIMPGEELHFTGNGFAPNEAVSVSQGPGTTVLSMIAADESGSFLDTGAMTIPFNWANTSPTFHLEGQSSHTVATVTIIVAGFLPQISPSTFYAAPGEPVTIAGIGFAPNEQVDVTMTNGKTVIVTTNATGDFINAGPFAAPMSGTIQFIVKGQNSNTPVELIIGLATLTPMINPSGWYVPSGSTIIFSGSGFGPQEQVRVNSGNMVLATLSTDATGNFINYSVVTGFGETREITYTFTGLETGAVISTPITVAGLQPYAWLDNYYVKQGMTIHVSGAGYSPNEQITVSIGSATATDTANSDGNVSSTPIIIPINSSGTTLIVTLTGNASNAIATTEITLAPFTPLVTPSTWYTPMGSMVTFNGTGFAPSESIAISVNDTSIGSATADTTGMFSSASIQIPYGVETAAFSFVGLLSKAIQLIPITVAQLYPGVQLSTYYAAGGTAIDVYGTGYASFESVTIHFDGQAWGETIADALGNFTFSSTVPYRPAGEKVIQATGTKSKAMATSPFTEPQMYVNGQLGTYAGAPGTAVTFVGNGYAPGETIRVTSNRTGSDIIHTFTVEVSGNFSNAQYIIPADFVEGPLTFTMSGDWSVAPVSITYYVTGK